MVGYDPRQVNLTPKEIFYVNGATSVLSRFFIHPLDVIKIRFQLQHEPITKRSPVSKYRGITQCATTILREEGLFAFWKGHLTGQVLSFAFIGTQFFWFNEFTRLSMKVYKDSLESERNKIVTHFLSGGASAVCCVLTVHPIDVIRTRLVSQGEPKHYQGIRDAFRQIFRHEGIRGFYRGLSAALFLTTPETALKFGLYQAFNSIWSNNFVIIASKGSDDDDNESQVGVGVLQSTVNSFLAGLLSKFIIYPFDLAKKRLQIRGFEEARMSFGQVVSYRGLLDCLVSTYRYEGPKALYKGIAPSLLKSGISSCVIIVLFESLSNIVKRSKIRQGASPSDDASK